MDEQQTRSRMQQSLESASVDIASIRTGRASSAIVENVVINAYGGTQKLRLQELASITASDPQTLVIEPWDKSIIGDIRKSILEANIGLNPSITTKGGNEVIIISLPPLTHEDREKYVKLLSQKLENAKVVIRQVRGDVMHDIKKAFEAKTTTEDERFTQEKKLQSLTDEFITKIESLGENKKKELLSV